MAIDYYTKPARLLCRTFCIFNLLIWFSLSAEATTVLPVSLETMADRAALIFHGRAISDEVKLDPVSKRVATFTTFKIIENIKGANDPTVVVKQIGGQLPGSKIIHKIHGIPRFEVGEEYIVFLPTPSRIGFSTPIGLSQGKFTLSEHNGETVVSNGRHIQSMMNRRANTFPARAAMARSATSLPNLNPVKDNPTMSRKTDFINAVKQMVTTR